MILFQWIVWVSLFCVNVRGAFLNNLFRWIIVHSSNGWFRPRIKVCSTSQLFRSPTSEDGYNSMHESAEEKCKLKNKIQKRRKSRREKGGDGV